MINYIKKKLGISKKEEPNKLEEVKMVIKKSPLKEEPMFINKQNEIMSGTTTIDTDKVFCFILYNKQIIKKNGLVHIGYSGEYEGSDYTDDKYPVYRYYGRSISWISQMHCKYTILDPNTKLKPKQNLITMSKNCGYDSPSSSVLGNIKGLNLPLNKTNDLHEDYNLFDDMTPKCNDSFIQQYGSLHKKSNQEYLRNMLDDKIQKQKGS